MPRPSITPPTPIDGLGEDLVAAFTGTSLLFFGGAIAATGVMAFGGVDHAVRVGVQRSITAPLYADAALYTGYILPVTVTPTIYVVGLGTHDPSIAGAGSAAIQALAVTFVTTSLLKLAAGRSYPLNGGDPLSPTRLEHPEYAREFHPFQRLDFPALPSWPSGHTSASISVVASLTAYYPERLWIPLVGYPVALAIGFGMIVGDRHWASDVVAGALIGHAIGYAMGKAFRTRARSRTTPALSGLTITPLMGDLQGLRVAGSW
jgi:membrane-associated phospholipid phosphatase